jgi:putative membrane protein
MEGRYTRAVSTVAAVAVAVVALIHVYILVLEMFLWTTPRGLRSFGIDQEFANRSATLAANQGLYNGFLAAGLIAGLIAPNPVDFAFQVFFLGCVIVAGLYGAATVNRRILIVQTVPAAIALALVLLGGTSS